MNCERFDQAIEAAFQNYGRFGVNAQLMWARDTRSDNPPYDWYQVCVRVTPVTENPHPYDEIWNYGGVITHERTAPRIGIRTINRNNLRTACEAAKQLPTGFNVEKADCNLFWPLTPACPEPFYAFTTDNHCCNIGAYTCKVYENVKTPQPEMA